MGYYKDYLYEDAITWTTDGANAGTVNYRAGKFYCTNVCGVLLSNEVKANQMIAEALNSVAKGYVSYVGNPKLMNNVMADIVIQIPTQAEEREQLSSFFAKLDNLITLHQRQPFLHSPPDISLIVQLTPPFYTFSWEQRKLEDYLTVSAEKNTGNIYGRSDVLSVSGDYGIVNQIEFQGRSFAGASVSNYGVVQTGDVVYTKSPLNSNPHGIIKTNKGKPGIVSTLYAVYHPKENAFSDFIQVYFEQHARMNNYMHPLVNKGAKNDMKVSAENALKGPVCFPSRIEQESISAFFSVLDNLITLHQRQTIVYAVIRSIRKVILAERQYFAPPMVRKSP